MVQENCVENKNKILIICGATATSKSALAIECAKILSTDIISADSLLVYKQLNVGTAKPTIEEMQGVKHHMIDVVEPYQNFSVGDYKEKVIPIIENLHSKGKIPIICGGTGFYINSILYDLSYGNCKGDLEVREKYKKLAEQFGNEYVYNILKEKDSASAEKLHFNDLKRVVRALEICESGCVKSKIVDKLIPKYHYSAYMFNFEREQLYQRINDRVDVMINNNLVDEVKELIKQGISLENQAMQGIGYKEIYSHLLGGISLEQAIDLIKLNTRHYAKRQITFFKKMPNLNKISYGNLSEIAKRITNIL